MFYRTECVKQQEPAPNTQSSTEILHGLFHGHREAAGRAGPVTAGEARICSQKEEKEPQKGKKEPSWECKREAMSSRSSAGRKTNGSQSKGNKYTYILYIFLVKQSWKRDFWQRKIDGTGFWAFLRTQFLSFGCQAKVKFRSKRQVLGEFCGSKRYSQLQRVWIGKRGVDRSKRQQGQEDKMKDKLFTWWQYKE